jgi:fluoride ion exporter CrcB/FEX
MKPENEFEKMVKENDESSFVGELWALVHAKKKYWLIPIIVVLLALGLLVVLSGTAAAPFIYTLF